MARHTLDGQIASTNGGGYSFCSSAYKVALNVRNAVHRPTSGSYSPDEFPLSGRGRWVERNGALDRLQRNGGPFGARIFCERPCDVPHAWVVLEKRDKAPDTYALGEREGRWRADCHEGRRHIAQTCNNGGTGLGLSHALTSIRVAERASRQRELYAPQALLFARLPVKESAAADSAGTAKTALR